MSKKTTKKQDADKDLENNGIGEPFSKLKSRMLSDRKVLTAYDELAPEFELIASLIELRQRRGISQEELARRIKTHQPAIARIESGRYRGMSVETLEKLAKALKAKLVIRFEDPEGTTP